MMQFALRHNNQLCHRHNCETIDIPHPASCIDIHGVDPNWTSTLAPITAEPPFLRSAVTTGFFVELSENRTTVCDVLLLAIL